MASVKKKLGLLLAVRPELKDKLKEGGGEDADEGADDDVDEAGGSLEDAVEAFFEAGKAGDYARAAEMLREAIEAC